MFIKHLDLVFARRKTFSSYLQRWYTWSKWSHVAVVTPDGEHVIEAVLFKGVVKTPLAEFHKRYSVSQAYCYPCEHPDKAHAFLEAQLGKKYNWLGVLSFVVRRKFRTYDRWDCVSLATEALHAGGIQLFHDSLRVTPMDLFNHGARRG